MEKLLGAAAENAAAENAAAENAEIVLEEQLSALLELADGLPFDLLNRRRHQVILLRLLACLEELSFHDEMLPCPKPSRNHCPVPLPICHSILPCLCHHRNERVFSLPFLLQRAS